MVTLHPNCSLSTQSATYSYLGSVKYLIKQFCAFRQSKFTSQLTVTLQTPQTPCWDFYSHRGRLVSGTITVHAISRWRRQVSHCCSNHDSPLHLTRRPLSQDRFNSELIELQSALVFQSAPQAWQGWRQAGLSHYFSNWASVIWDVEELRWRTSFFVSCYMMPQMNGDLTLRDLAIKSK